MVVRLEAADEERVAGGQSLHQGVQRLTELTAQRRHLFGAVSLDLGRLKPSECHTHSSEVPVHACCI